MEIKSETRTIAENRLIRFGISVSEAIAIVNTCLDLKTGTIQGTIAYIEECIQTNCP